MSSAAVLLDTHAWIWLVDGNDELSLPARKLIDQAAATGTVLIASISVWEVAMLERKGRLVLSRSCWNWVEDALSLPGLRLIQLSAQTALESCFLPGKFHDDPADRFIVATARLENAAIVTRDKQILRYAQSGHVAAIKC